LVRATIALAGAAVGIGNVLSSSIHSVARNPSLAKQLFGYAILGVVPVLEIRKVVGRAHETLFVKFISLNSPKTRVPFGFPS
ncbi:Os01g0899275, partial [Oryza sativa Japonica Group]